MDDLSVIDRFTDTFARYIDSGFGLLGGDVAFLTSVLIAIDITLAGLFWALGGEDNVLACFLRKVLYVGAFAFILNNFNWLAGIVFNSFAGLGLTATNSAISQDEFVQPGRLAAVGLEAGQPILDHVDSLMGFTSFFANFMEIAILLIAWLVVIVSFFVLAVQVFIALIEFKLTTLAGFVLVPFALWNKSAFLAERVLGAVVSSGIKILVLAVIVGIGTTLFGEFTAAMAGDDPTVESALALVLASIALFGLGIFGPGIATGLVSGAPQLGAGAAVGTAGAVVGAGVAGGALAVGAGRLGMGAARSATSAGSRIAGGATGAYRLGAASSGETGVASVGAGIAGVGRAGAGAVGSRARSIATGIVAGPKEAFAAGERSAWSATGGGGLSDSSSAPDTAPTSPDWARRLQSQRRTDAAVSATVHAVRDGDRPGGGANPSIAEDER
ncbi:MAG: P-type conjugative transfer protein TrbL [Oricola sp.]|nr:MAG: P-type conjugative transfer protein TrbL [Oricola sp.]